MADIQTIEDAVMSVTPSATVEQMARALDLLGWIKEQVKSWQDRIEDAMREWIIEHGQDIEIGPVRYYVGDKTVTKCRSVPAAVEALLAAAGGDMEKFCGILSANAIKHGASKALLAEAGQPELYDELFETIREPELKEGKPKLQRIDTRFVMRKPAALPRA